MLQNRGSLLTADKNFLNIINKKSLEKFKIGLNVYNFGENFLAQRRGWYVHDDYAADTMSESGYLKMVEVLQNLLNKIVNI